MKRSEKIRIGVSLLILAVSVTIVIVHAVPGSAELL